MATDKTWRETVLSRQEQFHSIVVSNGDELSAPGVEELVIHDALVSQARRSGEES